VGRGNN